MRLIFSLVLLTVALSGCGQPFIRTTAGGSEMVFDGDITKESVEKFKEKLAASPQVKKLIIRSTGGDAESGIDIGELVFQRHLDIEIKGYCHSACANFIFPAGRIKTIPDNAVVTWHGNIRFGMYKFELGDVQIPGKQMLNSLNVPEDKKESFIESLAQSSYALQKKEEGFYAKIGVNGFIAWIGKIPPYQVEDVYTMSAADMAKFGIKDVKANDGYETLDFTRMTVSKVSVIKIDTDVSPPVIKNPKQPAEWFKWE